MHSRHYLLCVEPVATMQIIQTKPHNTAVTFCHYGLEITSVLVCDKRNVERKTKRGQVNPIC